MKRRAAFGAETCDSPERVFWLYRESVRELAVQQRFLTEDEISDARAMIGWQFWAAPLIFGFASLGLGIGAIGGNPVIIFVFLLVFSAAVLLCLSRVSDFKKVSHDIEMRVAEVIEGAPEKVWVQRGVCYVVLAGRTIRVPPDAHVFGSLREANIVKIAFLPTAFGGTARGIRSRAWHIAVSAPVPDNLRSNKVSLHGSEAKTAVGVTSPSHKTRF